eukprot:471865-Pelagomonas_calceolata.AAC.2
MIMRNRKSVQGVAKRFLQKEACPLSKWNVQLECTDCKVSSQCTNQLEALVQSKLELRCAMLTGSKYQAEASHLFLIYANHEKERGISPVDNLVLPQFKEGTLHTTLIDEV